MPASVSEKVRPRLTGESSLPKAVPGVVSMSCQLLPPAPGNFQPSRRIGNGGNRSGRGSHRCWRGLGNRERSFHNRRGHRHGAG